MGDRRSRGISLPLGIDPALTATATVRHPPELLRDELESPTFRVRVERGPHAGASLTIGPLAPGRVYIGKSETSELAVGDPTVSRRHAALEVIGPYLEIADLGSKNGTYVNGVRIDKARLRGGETVSVGDTVVVVELVDERTKFRPHPTDRFGRVLGRSVAMRRLFPVLQRLASSEVPAIIEGETGTGKELVAESIHEMSARKSGPFLVCDCAGASPEELPALLFGEESTRGGPPARVGLFEEARGGTLLFDGMAELPLQTQARLLRTLERREICRVRGDRWLPVDVRVLVTTQRDLEREVELGRFREDLFHRINVGRVFLPPLRQRAGDVELLAEELWRRATSDASPVPADLLDRYDAYAWPGNVRELQAVVVRRAELGDERGGVAGNEGQPAVDDRVIEALVDVSLPLPQARQRVADAFDRCYLARVLEMHGGNVSRAAAAAGIARRYFYVLRGRQR